MRHILLVCALVACNKEPQAPDPTLQWNALKQRYQSPDGEWETAMRMLSVAKSIQPDDVKALRSVIGDTTPTKVLEGIAASKTIGDLPALHTVVLRSVTSADDPVLLALVSLADDMRKRGDLTHSEVGLLMLEATARWSFEKHIKVTALSNVSIGLSDFVAMVGRDVVRNATLLEAQNKDPRLLRELHTFLVEHMQQMEKVSGDQVGLSKAGNWRTEPDALDHPLISQCAKNFFVQLDTLLRVKGAIERARSLGAPASAPASTKANGPQGSGRTN
jgi:hypothetical protein